MTVDYKKQYLKYKRKYKEAKKIKMSGGELPIERKLNELLDTFKLNEDEFNNCVTNHINNKDFTINNITTLANKNLLIVVYAHWCTHCVNFIKEFGEKIINYRENVNNGNIKFLDGMKLSDNWKNKLDVNGFPTILKIDVSTNSIDNIVKKEYVGNRSIEDLYTFMND